MAIRDAAGGDPQADARQGGARRCQRVDRKVRHGSFVMRMAERLGDLVVDPRNDPVGLQLEEENLPKRIRGVRKRKPREGSK